MPAIIYDFSEIAGRVLGDDWFPKVPTKLAQTEQFVFAEGPWNGLAAGGSFGWRYLGQLSKGEKPS